MKILIVDAYESTGMACRGALQPQFQNAKIEWVDNAKSALGKITLNKYDAVIADQQFSALIPAIRGVSKQTVIVIVKPDTPASRIKFERENGKLRPVSGSHIIEADKFDTRLIYYDKPFEPLPLCEILYNYRLMA
jgi:hypothetical protein